MSATTVAPPEVVQTFDLEQELCNHLRLVRTAHQECAATAQPGQIVTANCGALFRTSGGVSGLLDDRERCRNCARMQLRLPCPYCSQ